MPSAGVSAVAVGVVFGRSLQSSNQGGGGFRGFGCGGRGGLLGDFVDSPRLYVRNEGAASAGPDDFERLAMGVGASREHEEGFIAGDESAASDHLVGLNPDGSAVEADARADSARIGWETEESHGDARCDGVVAIEQGAGAIAVDHDVLVAVAVEIAQSQPVGDRGGVEPQRSPIDSRK